MLAPNDKIVSGEYRMACPPKKPGGLFLFLLLVCGVIKSVEGNSKDGGADWKVGGVRFKMTLPSIVMLLGFLLFRKRVRKIWKDFWVTMKVYEFFDDAFLDFKDRTEISQKYFDTMHSFLWSRIMNNEWLLDWEDPEIRVEVFFLQFERNINQLLSESRTDGEALLNYYRSCCCSKVMSENFVSSDYEFDCNSLGDSEVDSWTGDDSV